MLMLVTSDSVTGSHSKFSVPGFTRNDSIRFEGLVGLALHSWVEPFSRIQSTETTIVLSFSMMATSNTLPDISIGSCGFNVPSEPSTKHCRFEDLLKTLDKQDIGLGSHYHSPLKRN